MTKQPLATTLSTKLVEQFNIKATDAEIILGSFGATAQSIAELDADFKKITTDSQKEVTEGVSKKAKELRLKYVKIRTGADKIHKTIKADVLLRSKAIDGAKNLFLLQLSEKEAPLMEVEKHFENIERERIEKVREKRTAQLNKIGLSEFAGIDVGEMSDEAWDIFFGGQKASHENKIAEEKKREADEKEALRLAEVKRKEDEIENERIKKENEKLQKEREIAEKKRLALEEKSQKDREKLQKEKDAIEKNARMEREAREKADKEAEALAFQKSEEIKEKAVKESVAKANQKYIDWLTKHNLKPSDVGEGKDFFLITNGNTFTLCKRVDSITI